jgi:hypothetical protein
MINEGTVKNFFDNFPKKRDMLTSAKEGSHVYNYYFSR